MLDDGQVAPPPKSSERGAYTYGALLPAEMQIKRYLGL